MSSVFIRLGVGGSVSYKDDVATFTDLPSTGNVIGDIRATIDTRTFYMWDGSTWQSMAGGGGGSPGGASGTIQYNSGGSFAGSSELMWDNTGKILNLNGLAIHALSSSVTLLDNQTSATTAISYPVADYNFSIIEYSITRNLSMQVGMLFVVNDSSAASITNSLADLNNDSGITFSALVSGGQVDIQYISTNTGFNATLRYSIRQWK